MLLRAGLGKNTRNAPEKQKEGLELWALPKGKDGSKKTTQELLGRWADLNIQITEEDIGRSAPGKWGGTST